MSSLQVTSGSVLFSCEFADTIFNVIRNYMFHAQRFTKRNLKNTVDQPVFTYKYLFTQFWLKHSMQHFWYLIYLANFQESSHIDYVPKCLIIPASLLFQRETSSNSLRQIRSVGVTFQLNSICFSPLKTFIHVFLRNYNKVGRCGIFVLPRNEVQNIFSQKFTYNGD